MTYNAGLPWTRTDDDKLASWCKQGMSVNAMADQLGRTFGSIAARLEKRELFTHEQLKQNGWTIQQIRQHYSLENNMNQPNVLDNTTVTTKVMIGSREAAHVSLEELLDIIEREEILVSRLGKLQASDAVTKLVTRHRDNIKALTDLVGDK